MGGFPSLTTNISATHQATSSRFWFARCSRSLSVASSQSCCVEPDVSYCGKFTNFTEEPLLDLTSRWIE